MPVIAISWSLETLKHWGFGGGGGVLMYPSWLKRLNIILKHALKFIACSLSKISFESFAFDHLYPTFPVELFFPRMSLLDVCPLPEDDPNSEKERLLFQVACTDLLYSDM